MASERRVLIAGCGYVGSRLATLLRDDGDRVFGLRRDVSKLPNGVEHVAADLGDAESLRTLPRELDCVVYAAAAVDSSDAAYVAAYVDGPRNLLAALARHDVAPRRFVFASSTGVFPHDDGSIVDEDTEVDAPPRVDRVREGERVVAAGPVPSIRVRFGGIYGPGRTRLIESVRNGTLAWRRDPPHWTNRIHRDDCARVLRHLLAIPNPADLYVAVDDEPAPQHVIVEWLAARLGVPLPPEGPTGPDRSRAGNGKRCRNARLRASGFEFTFPTFREGYATLLDPSTC